MKPAAALWGQTTRDTVHAIQAVEGADTDVMAIGPAGERLRALRLSRDLLEEPRGRGGTRRHRRRARRQARQGGRRHGRAQDRGGRSGGSSRHCSRRSASRSRRAPRRSRPTARRSSSSRSTRWGRSDPTTCARRPSPRRRRSRARRCTPATTTATPPASSAPSPAASSTRSATASSPGLKAKMPEYETIFAFGSMLGNAHAGSLAQGERPLRPPGHGHHHHGRDAVLRGRGARARLAHAGRDRRALRLGRLARHAAPRSR